MKKIDFKTLVECSSDGFAVYDGDGILIYKNQALAKITGFDLQESLGKNVNALADEGIFSSSPALEAFAKKRSVSANVQHRSGRRVFCSAIPVFDGDRINYLVVYLKDITENARFEEEIEKSVIQMARYQKELSEIRLSTKSYESYGLVAESPQMHSILETIHRVSSSPITILLLGETGVGKTMLARFIHEQSSRVDKPFIAINCGGLPRELLESELFGHEKGSFTGASEKKIGLFEAANGGTLLLDEVGELPLELQVKLLSVLQEKKIRRVGGIKDFDVDVRILAATNQNIQQMVDDGRFRKDLYYRLNILSIEIPPLSQRGEDIIKLIAWSLEKHNKRYSLSKRLAPETFKAMLEYPWPGNVRELDSVIERMVILSPEPVVEPVMLPEALNIKVSPKVLTDQALPTLEQALDVTERQLLAEAKRRYRSTRKMADVLKVSYATISRKLIKHGL